MKKILALVLALALVACASAVLAEEVMTHEGFVQLALEEPAVVETYVQATQS